MAENIFFETTPLLSQGVDDRPTPPFPLSEGLDPPLRHLTFFCPGGGEYHWSSHFAYTRDRWKAKSILTSNIRSTKFRRGYTWAAGSKAVDSSQTEAKGRPSGQIKGKGRRIRVCDIFNAIKHVGLIRRFLLNNKLRNGRIFCCSINPGKRCSAVEAICYGKICWRIRRSTYKNQI